MKRKRLLKKDKNLLNWLKQGGRKDSKKDFLTLLKRAASV
jgi:hypothetical protein